jgi:hypothetical protein
MSEEISSNTKGKIHDLELLLAEMFGKDGDGGRFSALEDKVEKHAEVIDALKTFRAQVLILVAAGTTVGGGLAALFAWLLK